MFPTVEQLHVCITVANRACQAAILIPKQAPPRTHQPLPTSVPLKKTEG